MERKGICENKGVCSLANRDAVQIITDDDAPFICSECQEELKPYKEEEEKGDSDDKRKKKTNKKLIGIIALAVLVLGGLGYGAYALYNSHQKSEQEKAALQAQASQAERELREKEKQDSIDAVNKQMEEAAQAEEDTRRADIVSKAKQKGDSIIAANQKLLEEKGKKVRDDAKAIINAQIISLQTACQTLQYENITLIDTMEVAINEAWKNAEKTITTSDGVPATGGGRQNLGYGSYEGPMQGGKPHGIGGVIRFTRSYTIDLKKANGETVEVNAGDYMDNVKMNQGRLVQGMLHRSNGGTRWIIIG